MSLSKVNKSPLDYFNNFLSNLDIFQQDEQAQMTKNHAEVIKNLDKNAKLDLNDNNKNVELSKIYKSLSQTSKLTQNATSPESLILTQEVDRLNKQALNEISVGDFNSFSKTNKTMSSKVSALKNQKVNDLTQLQALRAAYDPDTLSPSNNYVQQLTKSIPLTDLPSKESISSKDSMETTQKKQVNLTSLHKKILELNADSKPEEIKDINKNYQQYLLSLSKEVLSLNKGNAPTNEIAKKQKLTEVLSYPNTKDETIGTMQISKTLPMLDQSMVSNISQLNQTGALKLDPQIATQLDKLSEYHQNIADTPSVYLSNTNISEHLTNLADQGKNSEFVNEVKKTQITLKGWQNIKEEANDKSFKDQLTKQIDKLGISENTNVNKPCQFDSIESTMQNMHKACDSLKTYPQNLSLSEQLNQVDNKFLANTSQMDTSELTSQKQAVFDKAYSQTPAQQTRFLQSQYLSLIGPVMTSLTVANNTKGDSQLNQLSQSALDTENKFKQMTSSMQDYANNLNSNNSYQNCQDSVNQYQTSLTNLQSVLPEANSLQQKLMGQSDYLHGAICPCMPDVNIDPDMLNKEIASFSDYMDKLPQLPQLPQLPSELDPSSMLSKGAEIPNVTGPYTTALNNTIDQAKLPDLEIPKQLNQVLDGLNSRSENLPQLNLPNVSVANCLCQDTFEMFQSLEFLLPKLVPPTNPIINIDFIKKIFEGLLNFNFFTLPQSDSSSILDSLLSELAKLKGLLLDQLDFNLPGAIGFGNMPALPFDLSGQMQQLLNCLQSVTAGDVPLPAGVSFDSIKNLEIKLESVLNFNNQFYQLDQFNSQSILSDFKVPDISDIINMNLDGDIGNVPDISILIPNIDSMLEGLQSCPNIDNIYSSIDNINQTIAQIKPQNISMMNSLLDEYLENEQIIMQTAQSAQLSMSDKVQAMVNSGQAGTQSARRSISNKPKTIAGNQENVTPSSQSVVSEKDQAITEKQQVYNNQVTTTLNQITLQASTYQVLNGGATAQTLSASKAQPASTMATCMSSQIMCSFGIGPGMYSTIRPMILVNNKPAGNISDTVPMANIMPFPGCSSPTNPLMNPLVYPWPCMPMLAPFIPTNVMTMIQGAPINTLKNKAMCSYAAGGIISFINPNQITVTTS